MVKLRVLILCTGNSCRSQMAEGWVRHLLGPAVEVASAGTHPAGWVHPLAVQVMAEAGVDISHHTSKGLNEVAGKPWDLVITVCDGAKEECPYLPGAKEQVHVPFPDPVLAQGTLEERLEVYRSVRDAIREHLVAEVARRVGAT
ncbi:MAG: arsenate reductase ArsC [Thermoanaerobaculum sp.]|nr:arsenate reductase ArsC [Thermoanaerobaculum sp.]MDW7968151.1 arsenate reductase ArsC [Thermoanaerobaculum sp.]